MTLRRLLLRFLSALLSVSFILPMGLPHAWAGDVSQSPPPELKDFAVELWKFFLSDSPQWTGAQTFMEDQESSKPGPHRYGFFVFGLRDFLEHSRVRELQAKGREYRTQYWLEIVNAFLANEIHGHKFNLTPFRRILDSLEEITIQKNSGVRPMTRLEIETAARGQIQDRILNRTTLTLQDVHHDPGLRRVIPKTEMPHEIMGERPGGKGVDFERWREQQLEFIDAVLIQNFKTSLEVMVRDYGLKVGLHPHNEEFDPYRRQERGFREKIPDHIDPFIGDTRGDFHTVMNRLQFKIERDVDSHYLRERTRIVVSRDGGKTFDYILTAWSPEKGRYLGTYHFLRAEYAELGPRLPRGIFDLLHHLMPVRQYKYDMNAVALGMQDDVNDALEKIRKELVQATEGDLSELQGFISEINEKYLKEQIDNIETNARVRTGGRGSMDKWFEPDDLQDLIWYGFSQSEGFRHWYERDLEAARSGKIALMNENPQKFIPSRVAFKSMSFFKWLWFLFIKFWNSMWNRVGGPSETRIPVDSSKGVSPEGWNEVLAQISRMQGSASQQVRSALLRELFRLDQPFKGANIPITFDVANDVDFLGQQPVRVLNLKTNAGRPDLVVESKAWLNPSSGLFGIPRSRNQELKDLRVIDSSGNKLVHGKDFEVVENTRNGAMGVRLLIESQGMYKFVANFRSLPDRPEPEQMHRPVNMDRLKQAIEVVAQRGHRNLAQSLASYWARAKSTNTSISLRDLEVMLKDSTLYSLSNRGVDPSGNSCLNCKGSSSLAVIFLSTLFSKSDGVIIEERTCFRRGRQTVLTGGGAHSHVLLTFTHEAGAFAYMDTVASEVDPNEKIPRDILQAWTSDEGSQSEHQLPQNLSPNERRQRQAINPGSMALVGGGAAVAAAAAVYLSPLNQIDLYEYLQMAREMSPKVFASASAVAGTSYAIRSVWKRWQKYRANRFIVMNSQPSESQLIKEGADPTEVEALIENKENDANVQKLNFEAPAPPPLPTEVEEAMALIQTRFKDLEKHVSPLLVRQLSDRDPVIAAARLTHLVISTLSGALTEEQVRDHLKKEFFVAKSNEGGTQALLMSLKDVAESLRLNLVYIGDEVRARRRVPGAQHLADPVFRRDVERVFEAIIEGLSKVNVSHLSGRGLKIDCQLQFTGR